MTHKNWYPAAALTVAVFGCGASTDDKGSQSATGGSTSIDGGVPTSTGGEMRAFYGMMPTGGASTASTTTGGAPATGGSQAWGGYVTIYGPRFDKLSTQAISAGGNNACIASDAEGGALQGFENRTCETPASK